MAEVTGLTAAKMQEISDASVVTGSVNGSGHLILTTSGGSNIDAGVVVGPTGATGATGPTAPAPTGSVIMFAAATPPSGWIVCDGSTLSRSTYSALFGVIGELYGAGDGSTTFQIPNFQARFPRQDSSSIGTTGGSATAAHTHTIAAHSHSLSDAGHALISMLTSITYMRKISSIASWTPNTQVSDASASSSGTLNSGAALNGNTDSGGPTSTGSDPTPILPPYQNINFIIKT